MTALTRDLLIEQGTTYVLAFQWCPNIGTEQDPIAGTPYDLTGWKVRMQVRQKQKTAVLVEATTENDKIILGRDPDDIDIHSEDAPPDPDPTNGWIYLKLSDDDTDMISVKVGKYDMEAENPHGDVVRLLKGSVNTDPNITQEDEDAEVGG